MARLIAQSPLDSLLPVTAGGVSLVAADAGAITSVSCRVGDVASVSAALKSAHGLGFPSPNRSTGKAGARCIWMAPETAFLVGPEAGPIKGATVTDQSDGWVVMRLAGRGSEAVLARLVPVDLRAAVFRRGHTARTALFHVPASITRTGADAFDIMVFRSMAKTAVDELARAMKTVAALPQ